MGLIKEPKNIDLSTKSEPWTENELVDFRKLMQEIKAKKKIKESFIKLLNIKRIRGYNSINIKNGYNQLEIRSPRDLMTYGN